MSPYLATGTIIGGQLLKPFAKVETAINRCNNMSEFEKHKIAILQSLFFSVDSIDIAFFRGEDFRWVRILRT